MRTLPVSTRLHRARRPREVATPEGGRPGRRGSERGAAVLEFALVVPVLGMLVLGLFTGGNAYNNKQQLTAAAREGARFAATLHPAQCTAIVNCDGMTWAELARQVTWQRSAGVLEVADICVALVTGPGDAPEAVSSTHTTAGGNQPCYADGSSDTGHRVQVLVSRKDRLDVLVFSRELTLTARATARLES